MQDLDLAFPTGTWKVAMRESDFNHRVMELERILEIIC